MELFEGQSLSEIINIKNKTNEKFKEELIISIMKNILQGLNYIHSSKIIHRDIKPGK